MKKAILIIILLVCVGAVLVMLGRSARESEKMHWKARRAAVAQLQPENIPAAEPEETAPPQSAAQIVPGNIPAFARDPQPSQPAQQSLQVPSQWRAYFIEVQPYMAKLISPDDFVDILFTFNASQDGKKENVTATLLQKVRVLSSGVQGDRGWLVLAVDPRDAQYLSLAYKEGTVDILIRNRADVIVSPLKPASMSALFSN